MSNIHSDYTEMALVEEPTIDYFEQLGWETVNAEHETLEPGSTLCRDRQDEVVLMDRLRSKLETFNPDVPPEAINHALEGLQRSRRALDPVEANREVYDMLTEEVSVSYRGEDGEEVTEDVQVIDWKEPSNNDFLLVSQMTIDGRMYTKRPDLIGFVNGLPLLLVELKRPGVPVKEGFDGNISDYKDTIPQLFWYNMAIMVSNGSQTRVGSMSADWEHFGQWKKRKESDEREISLERALRATCRKDRFLDMVESFILYTTAWGSLEKILAKNHQFVGVNEAYNALNSLQESDQKLGVFWHTQGSGKSYSMAFFAEKVFRKMEGNWTFLIVTDRLDLDDQIYENFADADVVNAPENSVRADDGEELREMLRADKRYVFTLIQKFQTEKDEKEYPVLSDRDDIIVITDEAHRTQYGKLAMNMRKALPNAYYMAFTGTPLMEEEKTKDEFGDYVSVYDFAASEEDGATVPLYYENRIPEINMDKELLEEGLDKIVEEYNLTEDEEDRLSREYSRQAKFLKRDDRLETIAEDIVKHFPNRGFKGKGMVVSVDRYTAVRMYDKVHKQWERRIKEIKKQLRFASGEESEELEEELEYMEKTDMAVVISKSQNEIKDFRDRGLEIEPHRERMENEDLKTKFKDDEDQFRLVFLCAKWMTGFDCPSCSTLYLDKPMKNHTLMQAIARTNRRYEGKEHGLIVDYIGLLRSLKKALSIYAKGERSKGTAAEDEMPVRDKEEILNKLDKEVEDIKSFCLDKGINLDEIIHQGEYEIISQIDDAREKLVSDPDIKEDFLTKAKKVRKLFRAMLPDPAVDKHAPTCKLVERIEDHIESLSEPPDISHVEQDVESLLDEVIDVEPLKLKHTKTPYGEDELFDLSKIDFEKLKDRFDREKHKHTKAERLRAILEKKVQIMVRKNKHREDLLERFEEIIEEYNAGSKNAEKYYEELIELARRLDEEDERKAREGLSDEELAVFDILTKPEPALTPDEEEKVKKVAKSLLEKLKQEEFVLDWKKRESTKSSVHVTIQEELLDLPRDLYPKPLFKNKVEKVYHHVFESYNGEGDNIYTRAA
ncbi:type I restriction endonuclease subunit R [Candidatus Bipolaricaulota bacterium]|nr:type I restriction endonuclease subunit R [Candidatus Bipolaricaulota bacterium]